MTRVAVNRRATRGIQSVRIRTVTRQAREFLRIACTLPSLDRRGPGHVSSSAVSRHLDCLCLTSEWCVSQPELRGSLTRGGQAGPISSNPVSWEFGCEALLWFVDITGQVNHQFPRRTGSHGQRCLDRGFSPLLRKRCQVAVATGLGVWDKKGPQSAKH
jgi:hypothetical protein